MADVNESLTFLVHGPAKSGKAVALNTPILTSSGWKVMEDVTVGDKVYSTNGLLTAVVGVTSPMEHHQCYAITFDTEETITADIEHLWVLNDDTAPIETRFLRIGDQIAIPEDLQLLRESDTQVVAITDIRPVKSVPVKCITVANQTGMFLVGRTLIPTHNSTFAATAPKPILLLDAEHGHKFLPGTIKMWDPMMESPPECDGSWDICVVVVSNPDIVLHALQWLQSGQHCFKSVVIDSISEVQNLVIQQFSTSDKPMTQQEWGRLLSVIGDIMRSFRNLTVHPTKPLTAVVLTAMTTHKDNKWQPFLRGQAQSLPAYLFDIAGYLNVEGYPHPDPSQGTYYVRRLYIGPNNNVVSGERVGGKLGTIVEESNLNIEEMLDRVDGKKEE